MNSQYDVGIVGGGLLGLATAARLVARDPGIKLVILEKEDGLARHQSGRNSGVLHAGLYYRPGSLKARLARLGKRAMERFCAQEGIPVDRTGKLVIATCAAELEPLAELERRARSNRVLCELWPGDRIPEREPHARGLAALFVPETGIVDFALVACRLGELLQENGQEIRLGTRLTGYAPRSHGLRLETSTGDFDVRYLVNCGGLGCDRILEMSGRPSPVRIIPFRGDYLSLVPERSHLCRGLIYPVPDPRFPFLGPHFTRKLDGAVECGPNAVLSLAREGYAPGSVSLRDAWASLGYPGFWRLAARHWRAGIAEAWRARSIARFAHELRRLVPEVTASDLTASDPGRAGIRAQALARDGRLEDDFVIVENEHELHLLNAPSPGATASLALGEHLARRVLRVKFSR